MPENLKPILDKLDRRLMWLSISAGLLVIGAVILISLAQAGTPKPTNDDQPAASPTSSSAESAQPNETPTPEPTNQADDQTDNQVTPAPKPPIIQEPVTQPLAPPLNNPVVPPVINQPETPTPEPSWKQLTSLEQIALNPHNCLADNQQRLLFTDDGHCQQPSSRPASPNASLRSLNYEQAFTFNSPPLNLTALELQFQAPICQTITAEFADLSRQQELEDLKVLYTQYVNNDFSFIQDLSKTKRLYLIDAFSYLNNLQLYLNRQQSTINSDTIWSALSDYQHCQIAVEARNVGQASNFNNGCGLDLHQFATAIDDQQRLHPSHYLGPTLACVQAIQPFPAGDSVQTKLGFIVPQQTTIGHLIFKAETDPVRHLIYF